ncbi:MAG: nucleotidyltransferase [Thermoplasmata archaeon]|nr:nucleotidyltransferase [Thermoplasmata archaeon]
MSSSNGMNQRNFTLEEMAILIQPIAEQYNVIGVSLFGSRARGDFDEDSDYDLLIDVTDQFSYGDYGAFIIDVSDALKTNVDVVTRRSITGEFKRTVLEDEIHVF